MSARGVEAAPAEHRIVRVCRCSRLAGWLVGGGVVESINGRDGIYCVVSNADYEYYVLMLYTLPLCVIFRTLSLLAF